MNLGNWLIDEHDDSMFRLTKQVLELVPHDRRRNRFDGGNSIDWTLFHIARHASLALLVSGHDPAMSRSLLDGLDASVTAPDAGLQEEEQPWLGLIATPQLESYALSVLDEVRAFLGKQDDASLDVTGDVSAALQRAGIDEGEYGWLHRQWSEPNFILRWGLVGHITFHVGEMTAVRNQLGLSPFRA